MHWDELELALNNEFRSILWNYRATKMSEYKRGDIHSYLRYISRHRAGFKRILLEIGLIEDGSISQIAPVDIALIDTALDTLLNDNIESFAPEYSHFSLILQDSHNIPSSSLHALCLKYWRSRYPSIKKSFIVPLCAKTADVPPNLDLLLRKRLGKGKLDPFDESVQLCKALTIPPPVNYIDRQLSRLREMIHEPEDHDHSSDYSGCHCD